MQVKKNTKKHHFDLKKANQIIDANDQKILRGLGFEPERDGRIHCKCPIHGGDNPMGFSYDPHKKKWRCWTKHCHESCEINNRQENVGTGLIGLIRATKQLSFTEAVDLGLELAESKSIKIPVREKLEEIEETVFNSEILKYFNSDVKVFRNIGISYEVLARHHAFYCGDKNKKLYGRGCFPIFNIDNDIVGFAGYRTSVLDDKEPKWWYAGGVKLGNHLFALNINKHKIIESQTIVLVEGIKDVLMCEEAGIENVVSTFSSNISNNQRKLIVNLKIKNVVLAFDPDKVGKDRAAKAYDKLKLFFNVIDISPHLPKDPGKMKPEELNKIFKNKIK